MYFYVPKGTKSIDFYHKGYRFKVIGPDGKDAFQVPISPGQNYSVPVTNGQDGQVWSLGGLTLGNLHLYNVPNYIAASPAALMVPREVAEKDGLQRRQE
jgi:hypothetical protein